VGAVVVGGLIGGTLGLAWRLARWGWGTRRWWAPTVLASVALPLVAPAAPGLLAAGVLAFVGVCTLLAAPWSACSAGAGGWGVSRAEHGTRNTRAEDVSKGKEPPPRRWAIPRLIPYGPRPKWRPARWWVGPWLAVPLLYPERRGYCTCVVGSGGTGKSYVLLDLGIALLTGQPWLGLAVAGVRRILYVDSELDVDTMRLRAWEIARGRGLTRPPRGLFYLSLGESVATPEGRARVGREVRRVRAQLVLFDSLTIGAAGANIANADAWNGIIAGMELWGVPTVCIDHTSKAGEDPVGTFMKIARLRSILRLERRGESKTDGAAIEATVGVEHRKSNFGPLVAPFAIRSRFEHADPDDPAPAAVTFTASDAPWAVDVAGAGTPDGPPEPRGAPVPPARRWSVREAAVLDAWASFGPAGATAGQVAAELRRRDPRTWGPPHGDPKRAHKGVLTIAKRLVEAGALRDTGQTVTHARGSTPAAIYVAAGQDQAADAVAQAEAVLRARRRRPEAPGPSGGAGGPGESGEDDG
jgi:AAA domain